VEARSRDGWQPLRNETTIKQYDACEVFGDKNKLTSWRFLWKGWNGESCLVQVSEFQISQEIQSIPARLVKC